jgi:monoamine oxidase
LPPPGTHYYLRLPQAPVLNRMEGLCYTPDAHAIDPLIQEKCWRIFQEIESDKADVRARPDAYRGCPLDRHFHSHFEAALSREFTHDQLDDARAVFHCLLNYLRFHAGAELDSVDVANYFLYEDCPGGNVKVKTGMRSIVQGLARRLPEGAVQLNCPVKGIEWGEHGAIVETADGRRILAARVIITCSLGYLKAHSSSLFTPALPGDKLDAIEALSFGVVNKIFLEYEEPFWRQGHGGVKLAWPEGQEGVGSPGEDWYKRVFALDEVLGQPRVLVAWLSGPCAAAMERLADDAIISTLTSVLRRFLGDPSIPRPIRIIRSAWAGNPCTLGSYSFSGHGWSAARVAALARPLPCDENPR